MIRSSGYLTIVGAALVACPLFAHSAVAQPPGDARSQSTQPTAAFAAEAPTDPPPEDAQRIASQHFDAAVALTEQGEFVEAAEEFSLAYALHPHPATLLNLAKTEARLGRHLQALSTLEACLDVFGPALEAEKRQTILDLIGQQQARLAAVQLTLSPPEAVVFLDRVRVDPNSSESFRLNPGWHEVEVRAVGYRHFRQRLLLRSGSVESIEAVLDPLPGVGTAATQPEAVAPGESRRSTSEVPTGARIPVQPPAATSEQPSTVSRHPWLYPAGGAAILGVGSLVTYYGFSEPLSKRWQPSDPDPALKHRIKTLDSVATVLGVGGAAFGAIAVGWLVWSQLQPAESATLQVSSDSVRFTVHY